MYDIVFHSATVCCDGRLEVRDIAVRKGVVERVEPSLSGPAREEITCDGLYLLPGAIDLHVHLREPGLTWKEDIASGTRAAVASGVTTVLDMPNTLPPTTTFERFLEKVEIATRSALCNVFFYMALTADNLDEIERAVSHPRFAGVKVFLGSTTGALLLEDVEVIERATQRLPTLFAFHAEVESVLRKSLFPSDGLDARCHHKVRPAEAAVEGARLVSSMCVKPEQRLHLCHLSSADEIGVLKHRHPAITCEVTPHHLYFVCEDAARLGNLLKVNPPVRSESDRLALRHALANGIVDAVASDHAPHTLAEKEQPYPQAPSGVPGLDTLVPSVLRLVQTGSLSLVQAVRLLSENPARIAGLPKKGRVEEGYDADLMLCDLRATWIPENSDILSRCGWTPFSGVTLAARPVSVWLGGQKIL